MCDITLESGADTMNDEAEKLKRNLIIIASELLRFQRIFEKAICKMEADEQGKYLSQYAWFSKRVQKALSDSDLRIISFEGQAYDPGMATTPLNLEDFEVNDELFVVQTIEPTVMDGDTVCKIGTVILGRTAK